MIETEVDEDSVLCKAFECVASGDDGFTELAGDQSRLGDGVIDEFATIL
ncbi:MAG: hypothetical protein BMS9Abin12_1625 [Acidimicrobiia bacterium]|nr:MAG: hypothetical protein BMS9Abin12_1625 [Acidimicrobiia bacterium]